MADQKCKSTDFTEEENIVVVSPMSGQWLEKVKLPEINVFCEYVSYEAWEAGEKVSRELQFFHIQSTSDMKIQN